MKKSLREELLEGMCNMANDIQEWKKTGSLLTNIYFLGEPPSSFKPGVSDRLLFNRILDEIIHAIPPDYKNTPYLSNEDITACIIMNYFYWSRYGWFDNKLLEEAIKFA